MKHRTTELLCQTLPFHTSFISLQMSSTFHILPFFPHLHYRNGGMRCCPFQGQQASSQRLPKPNKDRTLHTPAKTEAVPKLHCCYVTTKDLISSCTLLPRYPIRHCNNEPQDRRAAVRRDIHTVPTAQETYDILKYLGLVI